MRVAGLIGVGLVTLTVLGLILEGPYHRWRDRRRISRIQSRELVISEQMAVSAATNYHLVSKAEMLLKQLLDADPLDVMLSEKFEQRVTALLKQINDGNNKGDK